MAKISIITPVYNAEPYISNLIESVIQQSFDDWELILINDGSVDQSRIIMERYSFADKRIKLINQENQGPSVARNVGIENAHSEWITFIDADDKVSLNYLEELYDVAANVDLVCAGYYEQNIQNPKGIALHDFSDFLNQETIDSDIFIGEIFNGVTGVLWSKLFKNQVIKENSLRLDSRLKLSEDLLFVLQYAKKINKIKLVSSPIYYYNRLHENGLSSQYNLAYIENFKHLIERVLEEFPDDEKAKVNVILRKRYFNFLIKMMKQNPHNPMQLKKLYHLIKGEFLECKFKLNNEDALFFLLIKNSFFNLAFYYSILFAKIRKIKNA